MKTYDIVQGSPEWFALRKGRPTGSEFHRIVKPNMADIEVPMDQVEAVLDSNMWDGCQLCKSQRLQLAEDFASATKARKYARFRGYKESDGQDGYAAELIAESLGWYRSFQGSPDTERGHRLEKEALRWLKLHHGIATRPVGFILSDCGRYGCSPDALTADGEPVEVKCPDVHTFIKWRIAGGLPDDHKAQCHGEMILTGAACCHFVAYADNPYLDNMYIRVERDEFTDKLQAALLKFCDRLDQLRRELTGDEYENLFPTTEKP